MSRHIHSKDPKKKKISAALKKKSGGTKVTLLECIGAGKWRGHCQKKNPNDNFWTSLGFIEVDAIEVEAMFGFGWARK